MISSDIGSSIIFFTKREKQNSKTRFLQGYPTKEHNNVIHKGLQFYTNWCLYVKNQKMRYYQPPAS